MTSKYVTPERLVGLAEVAVLLDVSKDTANGYRRKPGFPEPVASPRMGPIWDSKDITDWKRANMRAGKDQRLELACAFCGSEFIHMNQDGWIGVTHETRVGFRASFYCEFCPNTSHGLLYNHEGVMTLTITNAKEDA